MKKNKKIYLDDFYSYTELLFKNAKKFQNILKSEIFAVFFGLIMASFIFVWSTKTTISAENLTIFNFFLNDWIYAIYWLGIIAVICMFIPYVILMSLWFININHFHTTKQFNYLVTGFIFFAYFIIVVSFFNMILFEFISWLYDFRIRSLNIK